MLFNVLGEYSPDHIKRGIVMPKVYTKEFKQQCVESVIENKMTIQAASEELNVGKRSLITWINLHKQGKLISKKEKSDNEKLKRLKTQNKHLMNENIALHAQIKLFSTLLERQVYEVS